MKLRYRDLQRGRKRFVWLRGRDAYGNFVLEKMTIDTLRTNFSRTSHFKRIDSITIGSKP